MHNNARRTIRMAQSGSVGPPAAPAASGAARPAVAKSRRHGIDRTSRIVVAGAGSIGCYVGGCLALAGRDVRLLLRPTLAEASAGTACASPTSRAPTGRCRPRRSTLATDPAAALAEARIVLVTVKSGATADDGGADRPSRAVRRRRRQPAERRRQSRRAARASRRVAAASCRHGALQRRADARRWTQRRASIAPPAARC